MRTFLFRVSTVVVLTIDIASAQARQSTYDPGIRPVTPATTAAGHAAEDDWFAHLQFLASDALKGRLTGTPEFLRAVEYVEAQFKAIGLKPAGIEGYRQPVGFRKIATDVDRSSFALVQADGTTVKLEPGADVNLSPHVDAKSQVAAPLVFAGYGFAVPSQNFDDLAGVDLRGKVAVVFAGSPPAVHGPLKAYFRTPAERWRRCRWQALSASSSFSRSPAAVLSLCVLSRCYPVQRRTRLRVCA